MATATRQANSHGAHNSPWYCVGDRLRCLARAGTLIKEVQDTAMLGPQNKPLQHLAVSHMLQICNQSSQGVYNTPLPTQPLTCMSLVHSVRLSRSSCMISVLSL